MRGGVCSEEIPLAGVSVIPGVVERWMKRERARETECVKRGERKLTWTNEEVRENKEGRGREQGTGWRSSKIQPER